MWGSKSVWNSFKRVLVVIILAVEHNYTMASTSIEELIGLPSELKIITGTNGHRLVKSLHFLNHEIDCWPLNP